MLRQIELLVHAGAPSSRRDDDRYMAQAGAYIAFQGRRVERTKLGEALPAASRSEHGGSQAPLGGDPTNFVAGGDRDASTVLEDTQSAWMALESQLYSSVLVPRSFSDDEVSPMDQRAKSQDQLRNERWMQPASPNGSPSEFGSDVPEKRRQEQFQDQASFHDQTRDHESSAIPNVVQHQEHDESTLSTRSSYLRSPVLDRSAKRKRAPQDLDSRKKPRITSEALTSADPQHGITKCNERNQQQAIRPLDQNEAGTGQSQNLPAANDITSELPTSYSLSNITSGSSRARHGMSQRSASDPGPQLGSISPTALRALPELNQGAASHGAPLQRSTSGPPRVDAVAGFTKKTLPTVNDRNTADQSSPNTRSQHAEPDECPIPPHGACAKLSTEIHPPPPEVGVGTYTTHVTRALKLIAEHPDLPDCYKPVSTTRAILPLERGYWLIKPPPTGPKWTLDWQLEFWETLEKYITSGRFGWGIWCLRERDPGQSDGLGIIKVYCWGEVVKHIYQLLYTISHSQVRKMGLQWIDGGEEIVVQMRDS